MPRPERKEKRRFASPEARDEFILSNVGLGVSVANKNSASVGYHGLEFEDLLQAAWIAITRSSDYYDPEHVGHRVGFDNYAFRGVQREVQRAAINQVNAIAVGDSPFTKKSKSVRSEQMSASLEAAKQARTTRLDFQPPANTQPPDEIAAQREQIKILRNALAAIPAFERWVVMNVYGIGCEPQTLAALGTRVGLSRQRVQQIKAKAMQSLRESLSFLQEQL